MSAVPVFVRCRDGGLYRNPLLIFPEGFLAFDPVEPPELVLWFSGDPPEVHPDLVLLRTLGPGAARVRLDLAPKVSQRVVPLTNPWEYRAALGVFVELLRRIPRPQKHDGTERYVRDRTARVLDLPRHADDIRSLELPRP